MDEPKKYEFRPNYRRKLPHRQTPGLTLFITFRLHGSIPKHVIDKYKRERQSVEIELRRSQITDESGQVVNDLRSDKLKEFHRNWFRRFEAILDKPIDGPMWLSEPGVAEIVAEALHHHDGLSYDLFAFCIMSNHGHAVLRPRLASFDVSKEFKDGE